MKKRGKRMDLTKEMALDLRARRERTMFTLKEIGKQCGLHESSIIHYESLSNKSITKEMYNKLIAFYSEHDTGRRVFQQNKSSLFLTKEMSKALKKRRISLELNIVQVVRHVGFSDTVLAKYEDGTEQFVKKPLYNSVIKFYNEVELQDIPEIDGRYRIKITKKMRELLANGRKKKKYSLQEIGDKFNMSSSIILEYENGKTVSIAKSLYHKLISYYNNDNMHAKWMKDRIFITKKVIKFLNEERKKKNLSREALAEKFGISVTAVYYYEGGKLMTMPKKVYKKYQNLNKK